MTEGLRQLADSEPEVRSGPEAEIERVLGGCRGEAPGPTLIFLGGMHGNEPAGIEGIRRVLSHLGGGSPMLLAGEVVGLIGNRAAVAVGQRYIDHDLNRMWSEARVGALRNGDGGSSKDREDLEQVELLEVMDKVADEARGPVHVLDLHTTSGPGAPFATFGDTLRNRAFASNFPAPLVLGLEELLDGTLLEYLDNRGFVAIAFESGQHDDPASVDRAEAAIWIAIAAAGLIPESKIPYIRQARRMLASATSGLPRALEMTYRHAIDDRDAFQMLPGFRSFQKIEEGQVLARDRTGDVRAPFTARLLMPLYQAQGHDGFFVIESFHTFWLTVSSVLRRMRVDRIAHWLPGVRLHPQIEEALIVDRTIARWFALQLLHLIGYRKQRAKGDTLVVLRRRFDLPNGA